MVVYMLIWDQSEVTIKADLLCTVRGYLNYLGIAAIYHSYVLQALYRYWRVKRVTRFDSIYFRLFFIITQWILDIIIPLPVLLHGDLNEVSPGSSICAMSIFSIWVLIYVTTVIYFSSLGIILILYSQVVIHVKQKGAAVARQLNLNRDVILIRRIVQIVVALILCGLPVMVFFVISLFSPSSVPDYYLHFVYISVLLSIFAQMIILIIYTPSVKNYLVDIRNKYFRKNNRVLPIFNTQTYTNKI